MKASIIFPALLGQKFLGNRNLLVKSFSFSECHDFSMEGLSNSTNIKPQKEAKRMASGLTITFAFGLLHDNITDVKNPKETGGEAESMKPFV